MDFQKFLQKKMTKGNMLSGPEKDAHKQALLGLRKDATEMMKPDIDGLKKVTVASDSQDGLKKGLQLAEEMSPEHEASESADEEKMEDGMLSDNSEYPSLSPEECAMELPEVEQKLHDLMKLHSKLKS